MNVIAQGANRLFDLLAAPFGGSAAWGMVVLSALSGVVLLLLFKVGTPQERLAAARRRLTGHIYEIGLYQDDLRVLLRIQRDMVLANLRYLGTAAPAILLLLPPVLVILAQLDARYAHRPLAPGETTLVTAVVAPDRPELLDGLTLTVPDGLRLDSAPVRDHDAGTATWRVLAEAPGDHEVTIHADGGAWSKRLPVGDGLPRLAETREHGGWHHLLFNPGESPLPGRAPLREIAVELPSRRTAYAGVHLNWLLAFCLFSLVAGFALKDVFRVKV